MARLNRAQSTTSKFTIHEDDIAEESDVPVTKPRSRLRRGRKPPDGDDLTSKRDEAGSAKEKDAALATHFSSLELNECSSVEKTGDRTKNEDDTVSSSDLSLEPLVKTMKTRRALGAGTSRANPLLHPLPSTSAKKGRYSLENVENFRPKNESWGDEEDTFLKSKRLREKPARTLSKSSRKAETVEREYTANSQSTDDEEEKGEISGSESDSLDDFIVDDDEDISYLQDSDDEIDDEEEEKEESIVRPKTPRKLFRGAAPASVRSSREKGTCNTTDPKSVITVNELGSFDGKGKPSTLFNLMPTIDDKGKSNTPVKKSRASIMDPIKGSRESQPANSSSPSSQTTGFITPPTSPSKPRLQSPSKTKNRIPASPHRPSIDAFWNPEVINEWNETHSPRKTPGQRRGLSKFEISFDEDDDESLSQGSPTASPIKNATESPSKGSPTKKSLAAAKKAALAAKKEFNQKKVSLAENFFKELDGIVTGSEIQRLAAPTGGVRIVWSKTLNTTAGRANWKRITQKNKQQTQQQISASCTSTNGDPSPSPSSSTGINPNSQTAATGRTTQHHASIELAEKVIDSEHRLLSTLAHEYCHLANFMISNVRDKPHGTSFKRWAEKCRVALGSHPEYASYGIKVTTKHSYDINYKYLWCCKECGCEYGRHSKSINPKKSRCGKCTSGVLVQVRPKPRKQKNSVMENKENQDPLLSSSKGGGGQGSAVDLTKTLELEMK